MVMDRLSKLFKFGSSEKDASPTPKNRKRNGFFMELDEDDASTPAATDHVTEATAPLQAEPVAPQSPKPLAVVAPVSTEAKAENGKETVSPKPVKAKSAKLTEPTPTPSEPAKTPDGMTFSPNFLLSPNQNGGRRRPGPSLNPFMDMANQVQTTKEE